MIKTGIIDYGMGNLRSVANALTYLGETPIACNGPSDLQKVDRLVLPGVGAFRQCMIKLNETGLAEALEKAVLIQKKPILGICLGMQAMARRSEEGGDWQGLGWLDAEVLSLKPTPEKCNVPHIGWEEISFHQESPLFAGIPAKPSVYFVHSYHVKCRDPLNVTATCEHSETFTAAIQKNHIFGTQFHPEKSQEWGLKLLKNFIEWDGNK